MAYNMDNIIVNLKREIKEAGGGGGGGTTVEGNPAGSATVDLTKILIGETIYGIPNEAEDVVYDNTDSGLTATDVQSAIDEMVENFGDGVDRIYNACVAAGSTPTSKSPADIATAIGNITGGADIRLDNGQIANTETYISANFSSPISTNDLLLISVHDGSDKKNYIHKYLGSTDTFTEDAYEFTVTTGTIGLSYYSGDYRNIYAIVSILDPDQIY